MIDEPVDQQPAPSALRRWLPLGVLVLLGGLAYLSGALNYISLQALAEHHSVLKGFVAKHLVGAVIVYALIYVVVVALSLPGALPLSIVGGLLFGWMISAPVTVVAATAGATIVFLVVRTSLGSLVAERAGPFVRKLSSGFARDAFNYLLFLRLVPVFPFFVVNAVAGLCRVGLKPFVLATVLGIIPGSLVFAFLGTGFDSVVEAQKAAYMACVEARGLGACRFELDPAALVTREMVIAFVALGVLALVPVAVRRLRHS
jgi:uncharacterized membrane protein YdjX (TVP38/TMEM64 family)